MNKKNKNTLIAVGVILALLVFTNPTDVEDHTNAIYDFLMESKGTLSTETIMIMMNNFNQNYKVDNYVLFSLGSVKYIESDIKTFGILGQTFKL